MPRQPTFGQPNRRQQPPGPHRIRRIDHARNTKIPYDESQADIRTLVENRGGGTRYQCVHETPQNSPGCPYPRFVHIWDQWDFDVGDYVTITLDIPCIHADGTPLSGTRRNPHQQLDARYRTAARYVEIGIAQIEEGIASPAFVFWQHRVNPATGTTPFRQLRTRWLALPPPQKKSNDEKLDD